jgi:hypothetical protein
MIGRLGNSIRLRSRTGLQIWKLKHIEEINRTWKNNKQNTINSAKQRLGLYELKQHKPWLYEEHLRNLSKVRQVGSRHFGNKQKEYLKVKINELETVR